MFQPIADDETALLTPSAALTGFTGSTGTSSSPASIPEQRALQYGFRIGNIGLLVAAAVSMEVLEPLAIYPIPNTAPWLKGLINLRGNLVPVFDFVALFGNSAGQHGQALLLVLGKGVDTVAIPIDQHPQSLDGLKVLDQMPPAPGELKNHIAKAYIKDDNIWFEFDHQAFFRALKSKIAVRH